MGRGFLVARGMTAKPAGEENEPAVARAIEPSDARRSPVRHATSRPQRVGLTQGLKEQRMARRGMHRFRADS